MDLDPGIKLRIMTMPVHARVPRCRPKVHGAKGLAKSLKLFQ
jgi:hypothetical protein